VFDTMVSRGTLCHWKDESPRKSLLAAQLSLWGWAFTTKHFWPKYRTFMKGNVKVKKLFQKQSSNSFEKQMGKDWWPEEWAGLDDVPDERNADLQFRYENGLSEHGLAYNVHDVWTSVAIDLVKVRSTVRANPEYQGGPLDKYLLDACLNEDRAKKPKEYRAGDPGGPFLDINDDDRVPTFPRLPGQKSPTARYGEYMGTPRDLMPDATTPKYGSREHAEARGLLGDVWDRVQRRSSGTPSSAHALGRPAPGTSGEQQREQQLQQQVQQQQPQPGTPFPALQEEDEGDESDESDASEATVTSVRLEEEEQLDELRLAMAQLLPDVREQLLEEVVKETVEQLLLQDEMVEEVAEDVMLEEMLECDDPRTPQLKKRMKKRQQQRQQQLQRMKEGNILLKHF
jgi:hypothetical protein